MDNEGRGGGRKLSVARELLLLAASVEALRLAAEQKLDGSRHTERPHHLALVMVGGLHVLRDRIRLVGRILLGAVNPSEILCADNEAGSLAEGPGIVREWSPEEEERHLEAQRRAAVQRHSQERQPALFGVTVHKKPDDRSN
ncbi:MAG: hypothetical protein U0270_16870 [Labilithrix sp.]